MTTSQRITGCLNNQGYTVVEILLVLAITGVLAAVGVPNFNESAARNQVIGAAEGVFGMVWQARTESTLRDTDLSFNADMGGIPWCVGYSATPDCDCSNTSSCVVDVAGTSVLQVLDATAFPGITMTESFATGGGTTFSRIRGSASQAGAVSLSAGDWQLDVEIDSDGRARICNPNDPTFSIAGYSAC